MKCLESTTINKPIRATEIFNNNLKLFPNETPHMLVSQSKSNKILI